VWLATNEKQWCIQETNDVTSASLASTQLADAAVADRCHLASTTSYQKCDSINRSVFTWRTILPNVIPIWFEI